MEFTSSFSQTNFMGYCPPSQYDSSQYPNYGWEYHQEDTNSEHSNPWRFASEPQDEQENYEGYQPPPQNDSYHYPHGGWEYHQETANSEQSNHMKNYPPLLPSLSFQNSSSFNYASTQNSLQDPYNSSHQPQNFSQPLSFELVAEDPLQKSRELLERQEQIMEEQKQRWTEQSVSEEEEEEVPISIEISMEEEQDEEATVSSELSMKNKVVENEIALEMTREHKDSQLSQTFLTQQLSTLESMIERYEEEMKKAWEDQQTSSMKELLKQMLSVKEEGEEQASEEDNQERPNSRETERHMKDKLIEPPIQKALDEDQTPKITQQPCFNIKEVKATNKSTNSVPKSASKLNQANFKRKLAERKPRKGTKAETSPPLKSFLLTNWKKRKKVKNNMSS
ncbi:hypothetical protein AHAS_Ahas06G0191800 [Arachis hypogaea]